jgi:hypothetical protein
VVSTTPGSAYSKDGKSDFFKTRFEGNENQDEEEWRQMCFDNDFDPAYGLSTDEVAHSMLDWERRHIMRAAQRHSELTVLYIDPTGNMKYNRNPKQPPSWYQSRGD